MIRILVTGGSGFIGSNFVQYLLKKEKEILIINLDKLTYAANPENLKNFADNPNYKFIKGDICNQELVEFIFNEYQIDYVVHFAAESHVDRSIIGPKEFIETNILGTFNLLECCRKTWQDFNGKHFHHVSTDEVYGSLEDEGQFFETTAYDPHSPYSASKASSDHLVRSYFHTYKLPVTVSNCSNNYGPYQLPEKLIPLMINNLQEEKPLPVYGKGLNVRDWLYVEDHCRAIWLIINKGKKGETYNIGGENEIRNIDIVNTLCEKMAEIKGNSADQYKKLITFVKDRPGHDWRYAINMDKLKQELDFQLSVDFEQGITRTINWYLEHQEWSEIIKSGEYKRWIDVNYKGR